MTEIEDLKNKLSEANLKLRKIEELADLYIGYEVHGVIPVNMPEDVYKILGKKLGDDRDPNCSCSKCDKGIFIAGGSSMHIPSRMSVCPKCGNKRCPKGTDHNLDCTSSNDPGQKGSRFE